MDQRRNKGGSPASPGWYTPRSKLAYRHGAWIFDLGLAVSHPWNVAFAMTPLAKTTKALTRFLLEIKLRAVLIALIGVPPDSSFVNVRLTRVSLV